MRFACLSLVALLGCSASSTGGASRTATGTSAALEGDYPAARFVPASASYAVVAVRLRDAVVAIRELVSAVELLERDVGEAAEVELLGVRMLKEGSLEDLGLDLDGGVAAFSRGIFPTVVVRVADGERLDQAISRRVPGGHTSVVRKDGFDVFTWARDERALSWVRFDDWFALRVYDPRSDPEVGAWFDRLRTPERDGELDRAVAAARAALPHEPREEDVRIAPRHTAAHPGVVGFVRPSRVAAAYAPSQRAQLAACAGLVGRDSVVFAADMALGSGRGVIVASLSDADAASVARALAPPVPAGVRGFLDAAAVRVEVGFDPIAAVAGIAGRCRAVGVVPEGLARALGNGAITQLAFGGRELRPSDRTGVVGLHLGLRDRAVVAGWLDKIPLRRQFERTVAVAGVDVVELDPPMVPVVHYRLDDDRFVAAMGQGAIEQLVPRVAAPAAAERTVLELAIFPPRLPELAGVLQLAASALGGIGGQWVEDTASRLRRYHHGSVHVVLAGHDMLVRLDMRSR